jgi:hypothetical protein
MTGEGPQGPEPSLNGRGNPAVLLFSHQRPAVWDYRRGFRIFAVLNNHFPFLFRL